VTENLKITVADGIAKITLDRPSRMNAFTFEMIDAWNSALEQCRKDAAVKVILITGTGKAFSLSEKE
jgi:enoyl-CoA hydratase/carnithine racemase